VRSRIFAERGVIVELKRGLKRKRERKKAGKSFLSTGLDRERERERKREKESLVIHQTTAEWFLPNNE
jgi:hypothetical protein